MCTLCSCFSHFDPPAFPIETNPLVLSKLFSMLVFRRIYVATVVCCRRLCGFFLAVFYSYRTLLLWKRATKELISIEPTISNEMVSERRLFDPRLFVFITSLVEDANAFLSSCQNVLCPSCPSVLFIVIWFPPSSNAFTVLWTFHVRLELCTLLTALVNSSTATC